MANPETQSGRNGQRRERRNGLPHVRSREREAGRRIDRMDMGGRVPAERSEEQEAPDAPGRRERGRAASPRPEKGEKWHMGPKGSSTGTPELQDERAAGCRRTNQLDGSEKPLDLWQQK